MVDIESTREKFEQAMIKVAKEHNYRFMDDLLKRIETGEYATTWVDSAWMGWTAALECYT